MDTDVETCRACRDRLVFEVDDEDEEGADGGSECVPDDLALPCGCHFHWQCLLDQASDVSLSLKCPSCGTQLAANVPGPSVTNPFLGASSSVTVPTRYTSEGGVQDNLDILPILTEEAYLEANPGARPARAFHVMCGEGDTEGIVRLLREAEYPAQGRTMNPVELIRYQDPLANMKSALHVAIETAQEEVVWLLLWLASSLRTEAFPEAARRSASMICLHRPVISQNDIRGLIDDRGQTAEALAAEKGAPWTAILRAGALHPGSS